MKKLLTSVLFLSALFVGLFANAQMTEAQSSTGYCDRIETNSLVTDMNAKPTFIQFEYWTSQNPNKRITTGKHYDKLHSVYHSELIDRDISANTTYYVRTKVTKLYDDYKEIYTAPSTVTTPACPLPTVTVRSDRAMVERNGYATLSWTSTPSSGNSCSLIYDNRDVLVNPNSTGYQVGPITKDTVYKVSCLNGTGSGEGLVTVRVNQPAEQNPTLNFNADKTFLKYGESTTLRWSSTNASSCNSGGNGWNQQGRSTSGTYPTGSLTADKEYVLTCQNSAGAKVEKTVRVMVEAQQTARPIINNFSADPSSNIPNGGQTTLSWNVSNNPTSCTASGAWSGTRNASGSETKTNLTSNKTYTLTCSNAGGSDSRTVNVYVNQTPQNPVITEFRASPASGINYNGSTTLYWNSDNVDYCTASGDWSGTKSADGSETRNNLTSDKTYTLRCYKGSNYDSKTISVDVNSQSTDTPTVNLTASDYNISNGDSVVLTWSSSNADYCDPSFSSSSATNGSTTVYPTSTRSYSVICYNGDRSANDSVTIEVGSNQNQNPSVSTSSASSIGNTYATLNGYVSSNSESNVTAWFEWGTNYNYNNQTSHTNYGSTNGTSYNYYLNSLSENTTYYFRAVAENANGQRVYGSQISFTTTGGNGCNNCNSQPSVSTSSANVSINGTSATLNGYVNPNGTYTTRWFEWGTNSNSLSSSTSKINQGYSAGSFSEILSNLTPNTAYNFRAVAEGSNGQRAYGNTLQFTTSNSNNGGNNSAVTTFASSITSSSARLNGLGLSNSGTSNEGWFEWGIDSGLSNPIVTSVQNIGSSDRNSFSWGLESLGSSRTFYYRAVTRNTAGVFKGEIVSFRTNASSTNGGGTTTTTTNNTTNNTVNNSTSKPSLVFLSVSRDGETVRQGDTLEYSVIYRNTSQKNLRNVVIRIAIPREFEFIDTSRGSFSEESNMIVANGLLNPNESGEIRFRVKVANDASENKVVVVTANAAYTITDNNTQEEVFAYSTNSINKNGNSSNLGALALFGGDGFLPSTLLGWLLLILAIMGLILLGKRAYQGPANANGAHNSHNTPHDLPH